MKVFISWSGETSKAIASLLRKYLPIMLQQVRPFMSRHDIITGSRWSERIQEELEEASFGIIVLTPSNLSAKWLLFEAGAISKLKNSGTACLLCAGVEDTAIAGPLQQFQFQRFEKEPFFKLVRDMNQRTASPLGDESLGLILEKWWPDIEKDYEESVKRFHAQEQAQKDPRDEREFQDEILRTLRILVNPGHFTETQKSAQIIWGKVPVEMEYPTRHHRFIMNTFAEHGIEATSDRASKKPLTRYTVVDDPEKISYVQFIIERHINP